jgi:hypothetical protein
MVHIAWSKLIKFRTYPPAPQHHRLGGDQGRGKGFACHQKLQLGCHPDRDATMPLPQPPRIPHLGRDNMMQCSFSAGKPVRFQIKTSEVAPPWRGSPESHVLLPTILFC